MFWILYPMNDVCGREVSHKYVVFSVVFSMLRFVLGAPGPSTEEVSLREIIHKYNTSKDDETLELVFSNCEILESYFKEISGKLPEEDKKLLEEYKRIVIEITNFITCRNIHDTERGYVFKKIVELIRPEELYIANGYYLTDENIKDIRSNENIEVFKLSNSSITNMNNFFGEWNKSLVEVDISNIRLTSLPTGLENVASLRKLNIGYCNWMFYKFRHSSDSEEKNKEIKRYESFNKITSLDMHETELGYTLKEGEVSSFLELFPNVVDLDISSNGLKSMPAGLKNLTNLKKLSIKNNPEIFENWNSSEDSMNFENITVLDISGNRLGDIDENKLCSFLGQFPNERLERLDISDNSDLFKNKNEKEISRFLSQFENVKDLGISCNELSGSISIPLKNLKRLDISYNPNLKEIKRTKNNPELFRGLEELNICECSKLSIGNEFLKRLESVKYLNMMNVLLKGSDKDKSLFNLAFRKVTYAEYSNLKEKYDMNFDIFNYFGIYDLENLKVLCIGKDEVDAEKEFTSKGVKIAYNWMDYIKLVDREKYKQRYIRLAY